MKITLLYPEGCACVKAEDGTVYPCSVHRTEDSPTLPPVGTA